jgi:hypothetical protein
MKDAEAQQEELFSDEAALEDKKEDECVKKCCLCCKKQTSEFEKRLKEKQEELKKLPQVPGLSQIFKKSPTEDQDSFSMLSDRGEKGGKNKKSYAPLQKQIASLVFVLETEILLYHFMYLSYDVTELKPNGSPMSFEEKAKLIENEQYKLEAHLENNITDTHCIIASSADRLIIAFRGTVSFENMKTDYNSTLVEHPLAGRVKPLIPKEFYNFRSLIEREAKKKPYVHAGFVDAYDSIKEELRNTVEELMKQNPDRCIFVTGHSLGGGLAIVCALDLAVFFNIPKSKIALSTWGAPRCGTLSFTLRVAQVVPNAKRFVMSGDVITTLPIPVPFNDYTTGGVFRRRWYHVGTEILMDNTGNLLIRPSPMEKFMLKQILGVSPHLRLSYACALMAWAVRSHEPSEFSPAWWTKVISEVQVGATHRLKYVSPLIREKMMEALTVPGVVYRLNNVMVRDFCIMTPTVSESVASIVQMERLNEKEKDELVNQLKKKVEKGNLDGFDELVEEFVKKKRLKKDTSYHTLEQEEEFEKQNEEEDFRDALGDQEEEVMLEQLNGMLSKVDEEQLNIVFS